MDTRDNVLTVGAESKKSYETPLIDEHKAMNFHKEIWNEFADCQEAFQCFHCNCKG